MDNTERLINIFHTGLLVSAAIVATGIVLLMISWVMYYKRTGRITWWN